jgi:hypothetical protein
VYFTNEDRDTLNPKTCFDTARISGYVVLVYKKSEIRKLEHNFARKEKGLSYSVAIDNDSHYYFIPIDSILNDNLGNLIDTYSSDNHTELFVEYASLDNYVFEKFCLTCLSRIRDAPRFLSFDSNTYYKLSGRRRNKYCFRIYRVEADWAKIELSKDATFELATSLIGRLDQRNETYNVFIARNILNFRSEQFGKESGIEIWKTVKHIW